MSDNSAIEWTDATWNPLLGCTKVSPGCDGCYAIGNARIRESNPNEKISTAYLGLVERDAAGQLDWTGRVNLLPDRLDQPLRWKKPRRIFVNSQSDLFHDGVPDEFIARVFAVMAMTPHHTYQLLTKRHGRMRSLLGRSAEGDLLREAFADEIARQNVDGHIFDGRMADHEFARRQPRRRAAGAEQYDRHAWPGWPLPNVWLGVSVEDQKRADLRVPALLDTPAAVRFLSCEPLLGPVNLRTGRYAMADGETYGTSLDGIDWVIAGGESGPGARPMHPNWARSLRDQCASAGVAFHFKQWGEYGQLPKDRTDLGIAVADDGTVYQPGDLSYPDGPRYGEALRANHQRASLTAMYRVGKKFAGRELDDRTWDEFPAALVPS